MHVTKMHGARNDFVIVDARHDPVADAAGLARFLCDRRSGIGADGLLLVEPAAAGAAATMRVINADGSEAEMCGNGIRCFARYLDEEGEGDTLSIETESGIVRTQVISRSPEYRVKVALPAPVIPSERSARALSDVEGSTSRLPLYFQVIRVGNPHVVVVRDSIEGVNLDNLAAEFQKQFPDGVNVHIVSVVDEHTLRARHWERGVGQTQACGTGAAACAVAVIERGLVRSPVEVVVPGGTLTIEWDGTTLCMIGPAERVFEATVGVP